MDINYTKQQIKYYQNFPIKGVEYVDLNPIYKNPKARNILVEDCIRLIKNIEFDYFALIESRGFLIGSILADKLEKGIILLRSKKDRLPGKIFTMDNYNSLQVDSISNTGLKGSTYVEQIVPKYLNLMSRETNADELRKKSGR